MNDVFFSWNTFLRDCPPGYDQSHKGFPKELLYDKSTPNFLLISVGPGTPLFVPQPLPVSPLSLSYTIPGLRPSLTEKFVWLIGLRFTWPLLPSVPRPLHSLCYYLLFLLLTNILGLSPSSLPPTLSSWARESNVCCIGTREGWGALCHFSSTSVYLIQERRQYFLK